MKQFLSQIIPRLNEYSNALNRKEIFVNKTWLLIDSKSNFTEFTFERKVVYKSVSGGQAKVGKWKLLTPTNQIWLEFNDGENYMLKMIFASDKVLILTDNIGDNFFPFINTMSDIRSINDLQKHLKAILNTPPVLQDDTSTDWDFVTITGLIASMVLVALLAKWVGLI